MTEAARSSSPLSRQMPTVEGLSRAFYDEAHGPLPAMLLALTVLAGVVDATSILRLGHVFVATMTGNLVFIGLAIAGAIIIATAIAAHWVSGTSASWATPRSA